MAGVESLGHAGSGGAVQLPKKLFRPACGDPELLMALGQPTTHRAQLVRTRHIGACRDSYMFCGEMKVEPGRSLFPQPAMRKDRGEVRLVWRLVRAEACVAI